MVDCTRDTTWAAVRSSLVPGLRRAGLVSGISIRRCMFTLGSGGALRVVAIIAGVDIRLCCRPVAPHHRVEPEMRDPIGVAEELVLDERLDVVLPDAPQAPSLLVGRRAVLLHEVARSEQEMGASEFLLEFLIDGIHEFTHPSGLVLALQPPAEQTCHRTAVGEERHEVEPSSQCRVH